MAYTAPTTLTADRLRLRLAYDPETGVFTRVGFSNPTYVRRLIGRPTGRVQQNGYVRICVDQSHHFAHRLAWLFMTGSFPAPGLEIDHINRMPGDNRWVNLRTATRTQNAGNRKGTGASGAKGVTWNKNCEKWQASILLHGRVKYLGLFSEKESAKAAYNAAGEEYYGKEYFLP